MMDKKEVLYIAGPMRGYEDFNFPAFDAARDALTAQGIEVISPADMDREHGIDIKGDYPDGEELRKIISRDIDAVMHRATGIALLPGYERSKGAKLELALAEFLGLDVYLYTTGALLDIKSSCWK